LYILGYIKCVNINLIYYSDKDNEEYINYGIEEISKFLENSNLNATLEKNTYTSATTIESYSETMEFLLNSKSSKFDMIIIDTVDSKRFSKYFENLSQSLPATLMNQYKNGIASELYSVKNSTYALVINNFQ